MALPDPPAPPPPPDATRDEEPQVLRPDHYDHDTAFARAAHPELRPKRQEQVTLPRWTVLFIYLLVITFFLVFAKSTFNAIGK